MKKRRKSIAILLVLVLTTLIFATACDRSEPETHQCALCKVTSENTKKYKTDNGTELYYCEKCSSTCAICGEKAEKDYTNALDQIVFVCKDCYKNINSDD